MHSFVVTGRTRQLRGNNLVPIVFEISCELPDKYVRIDEFPAQDQDPTTSGFNGDDLIQVPPPPPAPPAQGSASPAGGGGPTAAQRRVIALKQDFARLTLGMFAASFPSYPLTFKYLAEGRGARRQGRHSRRGRSGELSPRGSSCSATRICR